MRVLIADEMHPSLFVMLDNLEIAYDYLPKIKRPEIIAQIADYEVLIIRSKTAVDQEVLAAATRLRVIGRAGAGLDLIDADEAAKRNIKVFAANEGNRDTVAEHVVGMLLTLLHKIHWADAQVRKGIWLREDNRGVELGGKTVGLIGYGHNGQATARRLSGFGVRVLAYDKYRADYADAYAQEATLSTILAEADVLSLHVPLTDETYRWVNTALIEQFMKPFYFINAARGEIAVLADVLAALQQGKLLGACLDVLENEKLNQLNAEQQATFEALCQLPNVVLTPHVAGWSHESYVRINEVVVKQLKAFLFSE
jgi:D-3-phosphoglycerate dehydrogenase / 2-oxoglutarate reductase